jgi:hypothetical protein
MKKVLVVSHERSGTHFLINSIAANYGMNGQWIDVHCKDYIDPEDSYKESYKKDIKKFMESQYDLDTNRIYKSHHQFGYFDGYFDEVLEHFDVFYIYRDGRDTLASCYNYFEEAQVTAFPNSENIEEFLFNTKPYLYPYDGAYSYVASENMIERWHKHIETWKPIFDKINVVSYTKLKNEFDLNIGAIGLALGYEPPMEPKVPAVGSNSINPGKGINGAWKDVMSEETSEKMMDIVKSFSKQLKK